VTRHKGEVFVVRPLRIAEISVVNRLGAPEPPCGSRQAHELSAAICFPREPFHSLQFSRRDRDCFLARKALRSAFNVFFISGRKGRESMPKGGRCRIPSHNPPFHFRVPNSTALHSKGRDRKLAQLTDPRGGGIGRIHGTTQYPAEESVFAAKPSHTRRCTGRQPPHQGNGVTRSAFGPVSQLVHVANDPPILADVNSNRLQRLQTDQSLRKCYLLSTHSLNRPLDAVPHVGYQASLRRLPIGQRVIAGTTAFIGDQPLFPVHRRHKAIGDFVAHRRPAARISGRFALQGRKGRPAFAPPMQHLYHESARITRESLEQGCLHQGGGKLGRSIVRGSDIPAQEIAEDAPFIPSWIVAGQKRCSGAHAKDNNKGARRTSEGRPIPASLLLSKWEHPILMLKIRIPLLVLGPAVLCAQPSQQWTQGDPTPQEQQAIEWLNSARKDPVGTLTGIVNLADSDPVIAGFMLAQQPTTASQLEAEIQTDYHTAQANSALFPGSEAISNAPLVFYPLFQAQATAWSAQAVPPPTNFSPLRQPPTYIYPTPFFTDTLLSGPANVFTGPNATGGSATFGPYGANYTEISQANLYGSYITPREWMLSQLTDSLASWSPPPDFLSQGDSLPNFVLGHTRMVGIHVSPGQSGNQILTLFKGNNEFFTVSDLPFGNANTVFITGVAYRDNNSNGAYDPGEGIAGIKVTPDHGDWFAVTSTSGGYAIPVPANSGTYTLSASGGALDGATTTIAVGADNVKADWVLPAAATVLPPQTTVPESDGTTQLVGLSTRGLVQIGENVLIGGFVIEGPTGAQKNVLIRGVGPSLQTAGFPASECIPATQIQLFDNTGSVIASNEGWTTAPDGGAAEVAVAAQVGDFPLTNWAGGGGDSALVTTLAPGAYTVIVSPAPGAPPAYQTGYVGLVEIYDASPNDGSQFVNISTRGLVGTGDSQMIVGCTVSGTGHKRLLIRGVGPALGQFGLTGLLANPFLTLYNAQSQPIESDDDWSNSPQTNQIRTLAAASGAFDLAEGSVDSSLLVLAAPGNYTAVVGAKSGSALTGLALVELYETP
jgi:hypothetical protein